MNDLEFEKFEKYRLAQEAIRDILFMYKTLVDYSGLFEDFGAEDGLFDPAIYVDCGAENLGIDESDAKLLHEGSAIKLICAVFQAWGQGGYSSERDTYCTMKAKTLLAQGRLKHIPDLEHVLNTALMSYDEGKKLSNKIYKKYVLAYFEKLASSLDGA